MSQGYWHLALAATVFGFSSATAQEWRPTKNVDIVVSSGAGGAADRQARIAQRFVQAIPGVPSVTVSNRPGGGGLVAWTFIAQQKGDAHYIATINVALVTNQVLGLSSVRYQDLTPLNILLREYIALYTRTESPIGSTRDLMARLKRDPASVSFGFSRVENRWIGQRLDDPDIDIAGMARMQGAVGIGPLTDPAKVQASIEEGMAAVLAGRPCVVDARVLPGYDNRG